ncbi:MAG: lipopolysaccharide heptosyltransferase II [bacterium]
MVSINKTLVIRFSSIGDVILASPLLRVLRKQYPSSQIDFVTKKEFADLVKTNPNLNYTYEFEPSKGFEGLKALKAKIRAEGYDLIIDIHDSLRSRYLRSIRGVKKIAVINKRVMQRSILLMMKKNLYGEVVPVADRYIEPVKDLGVTNDGKGLEIHIPDEAAFGVSASVGRLRLNQYEKVVGLCPGARHYTKRWPVERFIELGSQLAMKQDAKILLFGGPDDAQLTSSIVDKINRKTDANRAFSFGGSLNLLETAAAMEYCDLLVTNDSGLMHVAVARQKKVLAIFGSTVEEFGFFPYSSGSVVIQHEGLYCRPCSHVGRMVCPEKHFRCMIEISPQEVFNRAAELLEQE